jgi:kynureninase
MQPDHRDAFHVPGAGPYLLTHSVGCLPRRTESSAIHELLRPWRELGGDAWPEWLTAIDRFCDALAALLGGRSFEYCPQPNVSAALTKLIAALPRRDRTKRVWIAAEDAFPSLGYVLQKGRQLGFELRLIPRTLDPADPEIWDAALTPDVFGALITHVHSNTGRVTPVKEITQACAERGIFSIIDIAQSAGILPLSIDGFAADAVLGSCVKWLCGGPGAGFMWLRESLIPELEPVDVGWFSHADPLEMDIRSFRYAATARRFWGGTPAIAPYVLATPGLELLAEIGIGTIFARNRELIQAFLDSAPAELGGRVDLDATGGTLCMPLGSRLGVVSEALRSIRARFDCRGPRVRLSFHLCNSVDEAILIGQAWPR